jgi:hypothetical protein
LFRTNYHFNLGDGEDRVYDSLAEGGNVLSFGENIQKEDIHVSENGGGLRIDYGGQGDAILLGTASADDTVFRSVRLADGTEFDFSELLRAANHAPEVTGNIPAQSGKQGEAYALTLPANLFTDPDGDTLALNVTLANGSALPAWLTFNAATRSLSGTPGKSVQVAAQMH